MGSRKTAGSNYVNPRSLNLAVRQFEVVETLMGNLLWQVAGSTDRGSLAPLSPPC